MTRPTTQTSTMTTTTRSTQIIKLENQISMVMRRVDIALPTPNPQPTSNGRRFAQGIRKK